MMKIPLNDLSAQHKEIRAQIKASLNSVIENSRFINAEPLQTFEKHFAAYCGAKYGIGTANGTASLSVALTCLGVKAGDEVLLPVNTFVATAFAITLIGAKPVFVDVKEEDLLIDPSLVEKNITRKTKAIIAVHLYGNVCDMKALQRIARKHKLVLVEDCAQAHGSTVNGKKVPISDVGCFSFFPSKSLGAMGDAGAIVTNNKKLAKKMKQYVNQGRAAQYLHEVEGYNFRLDTIQAAILDVKLKNSIAG